MIEVRLATKEDRINKYRQVIRKCDISSVKLDKLGFFTAPASRRRHGAYEGGLFDHSFEVMKTLVTFTEKLGLVWERPDSPYIVGLFHDFCKCNMYLKNEEEIGYRFNDGVIMPGHGELSVMMLQRLIYLTDEEIACIRWHMGAYETDTSLWNYYGRAVSKYPNVLFTHTADMYASKVIGV